MLTITLQTPQVTDHNPQRLLVQAAQSTITMTNISLVIITVCRPLPPDSELLRLPHLVLPLAQIPNFGNGSRRSTQIDQDQGEGGSSGCLSPA